jgi:hypothetical protein
VYNFLPIIKNQGDVGRQQAHRAKLEVFRKVKKALDGEAKTGVKTL